MERDEKVDLLANLLTEVHQDNVRHLGANEKLADEVQDLAEDIRASKQEQFETRQALETFTAEIRLAINDRIEEMSLERLADALSRKKVDQLRALLYAREKGMPYDPHEREPSRQIKTHRGDEEEERDHGGKAAGVAREARGALKEFRKLSLLGKLLLVLLLFAAMGAAMAINDLLHTRRMPREGQTHSDLK